jgi:hypothetical protein
MAQMELAGNIRRRYGDYEGFPRGVESLFPGAIAGLEIALLLPPGINPPFGGLKIVDL